MAIPYLYLHSCARPVLRYLLLGFGFHPRVTLVPPMSVASRLRNLHWLCACLPPTLPEPQVSSYVISLDPEDVEDMGQVGALNRALENTIGMRAHGLVIRERGIGVQHLVDVLREGLEKCKDGRDAILEKWVEDLEKVVMETCQTANTLKVGNAMLVFEMYVNV